MERWLELSVEENLRFAAVIADLGTRLVRHGMNPVWLSSPDNDVVDTIVVRIEQILSARQKLRGTQPGHPAPATGNRAPS